MTDRAEFSVAEFYDNDTHRYVERWLDAGDALRIAAMRAIGPSATKGSIKKIIVTDGGDSTVFEWQFGKGITFPPVGENK